MLKLFALPDIHNTRSLFEFDNYHEKSALRKSFHFPKYSSADLHFLSGKS